MLFADEEHYQFYLEKTERLQPDCYLRALIYTVGICPDTRYRWTRLYDERTRCIEPEQVNEPWQTDGSSKVTRLAFQLFTDGTPSALTDTENNREKEDFAECQRYSVSDVFCCEYAPYFMEAVKIRYPEYCTGRGINRVVEQSSSTYHSLSSAKHAQALDTLLDRITAADNTQYLQDFLQQETEDEPELC